MRSSEFIPEAEPKIVVKKRRIIPGQSQTAPAAPEPAAVPNKVPRTFKISKPQVTPTVGVPDQQRLRMLNDLMDKYDQHFRLMKTETLPKLISRAQEVSRVWDRPVPQELLQPVDHDFYFNNKKSMLDYYDNTMKDYRKKIDGLRDFIKYPARYGSIS